MEKILSVTVPKVLIQATMTRFAKAWACVDVDGLMSLMSDVPVYRTSGGLIFEGREAVRQGFVRMCQPANAPPPPAGIFQFFEDKCLSYWTLSLPVDGGATRTVDGIDVISFDPDGRIRIKDAYRKGA